MKFDYMLAGILIVEILILIFINYTAYAMSVYQQEIVLVINMYGCLVVRRIIVWDINVVIR